MIEVINADGTGRTALSSAEVNSDLNPIWSPDGTKIAFISTRDGVLGELYVMNADGSAETRLTTTESLGGVRYQPDWSPDGSSIVFVVNQRELYLISPDGTGFALVATLGRDPVWSPDGSRILYNSTRDRQPIPGGGHGVTTRFTW